MPIRRGTDIKGPYYQFGNEGKKYHYVCKDTTSRRKARNLANKQGQAVVANILNDQPKVKKNKN